MPHDSRLVLSDETPTAVLSPVVLPPLDRVRTAMANERPDRYQRAPGRHRAPEPTGAALPEGHARPIAKRTMALMPAERLVGEGPTQQIEMPAPVETTVLPSRKPTAAWLAETWNSVLARGLGALRRGGAQ